MAMTKKHYDFIARDIRATLAKLDEGRNDYGQANYGYDAVRALVNRLTFSFSLDNDAFSGEKFLKACGFKK